MRRESRSRPIESFATVPRNSEPRLETHSRGAEGGLDFSEVRKWPSTWSSVSTCGQTRRKVSASRKSVVLASPIMSGASNSSAELSGRVDTCYARWRRCRLSAQFGAPQQHRNPGCRPAHRRRWHSSMVAATRFRRRAMAGMIPTQLMAFGFAYLTTIGRHEAIPVPAESRHASADRDSS